MLAAYGPLPRGRLCSASLQAATYQPQLTHFHKHAVFPFHCPSSQSNVADLQRFTKNHSKLQCFDLGFALDTFRMVRLPPSEHANQSSAGAS